MEFNRQIINYFSNNNKINFYAKGILFEDIKKYKNINVVRNNLNENEYLKKILQFDIFILLYSENYFKYRTSGVLLDVLFHYKVCIVLEKTELANFVEQYQIGYVCKNSIDDVLQKIDLLINDSSFFFQNRAQLITKHKKKNNLQNLFKLFNKR